MQALIKWLRFFILLAPVTFGNGCMTYITQVRFWDAEEGKEYFAGFPRVYQQIYKERLYNPAYLYGGVRTICEWIDPDNGAAVMAAFIIDLPFCFCGDTILLPLTIGQEIYESAYPSTDSYKEKY